VISGIDHVQVAAPPGCEAAATEFYGGLLGMERVAKPEALAERGGCWFRAGAHELHVGVEQHFVPAGKAHPALAVESPARLHELADSLTAAGHSLRWDEELDGVERFFVRDPFGNRLELVARVSHRVEKHQE
jgi:catechol 2,3-dioxygenase-like lactoylglutathione lyase family enzyme